MDTKVIFENKIGPSSPVFEKIADAIWHRWALPIMQRNKSILVGYIKKNT
jgi:hypothetical protein